MRDIAALRPFVATAGTLLAGAVVLMQKQQQGYAYGCS